MAPAALVDELTIQANGAATKDWPTHGLDYAETRFSKLDQINDKNAKELGLVWSYDLDSSRGVEATPLVVDGVMYVTASWSIVHAIDVRTGRRLWTYDPEVPRSIGYKGCCDVVNRGVAIYKGKVFVGSFDGRLIALDAANGKEVWKKDTIIDHAHSYTITGAPRAINGKIIIGNGGAEYGVRGYVTAYDAEDGAQKWRWFTVPGDPSKPFEDESMAMAAKTWDPAGKYWITGGGGTAYDSMSFDPDLNLLYIGTGNGSPWSRAVRSPSGGDNLFLNSIVALNPDTGKYVWHFQETPGESFDYTATQSIILADLNIDGHPRKVLLHAPKNGFFYVIDRTNGQLISVENIVDVKWAKGYDEKGRPILNDEAPGKPFDAIPGPFGAHNWQSMSFNPQTGLAYIPAQTQPVGLMGDPNWKNNTNNPGEPGAGLGMNLGVFMVAPSSHTAFGRLIAWDPVQQKEIWRHEYPTPSNGGTLTTAGNLVFQGTADARFAVYNATTGEQLWNTETASGVIAAPVTFLEEGVQYVSIAVGWGGAYGISRLVTDRNGRGTVLTFAAGGKSPMPKFAKYEIEPLISGVEYDPADVKPGATLYVSNCLPCHGLPGTGTGGAVRNLGHVPSIEINELDRFVFKGPLIDEGMPDFTGKLSAADVQKVKAFIAGTADSTRQKDSN